MRRTVGAPHHFDSWPEMTILRNSAPGFSLVLDGSYRNALISLAIDEGMVSLSEEAEQFELAITRSNRLALQHPKYLTTWDWSPRKGLSRWRVAGLNRTLRDETLALLTLFGTVEISTESGNKLIDVRKMLSTGVVSVLPTSPALDVAERRLFVESFDGLLRGALRRHLKDPAVRHYRDRLTDLLDLDPYVGNHALDVGRLESQLKQSVLAGNYEEADRLLTLIDRLQSSCSDAEYAIYAASGHLERQTDYWYALFAHSAAVGASIRTSLRPAFSRTENVDSFRSVLAQVVLDNVPMPRLLTITDAMTFMEVHAEPLERIRNIIHTCIVQFESGDITAVERAAERFRKFPVAGRRFRVATRLLAFAALPIGLIPSPATAGAAVLLGGGALLADRLIDKRFGWLLLAK